MQHANLCLHYRGCNTYTPIFTLNSHVRYVCLTITPYEHFHKIKSLSERPQSIPYVSIVTTRENEMNTIKTNFTRYNTGNNNHP